MTDPIPFREDFAQFCHSRLRPLLLVLGLLVTALILSGCSTFAAPPYWFDSAEPRAYVATIYAPMTEGIWGANYDNGIVVVSTTAPALLWDCIERHEIFELTTGKRHWPQQLGGVWCDETNFERVPWTNH